MNCTYPVDIMTISVFETILFEVIKEENPVMKILSIEKNYDVRGTTA